MESVAPHLFKSMISIEFQRQACIFTSYQAFCRRLVITCRFQDMVDLQLNPVQ
jgi:hypothetical protein